MKESRLITRGTVFAVSLAFFSASGFAQASSDKLLGTLKAELAHNYAQLQKQQVKPYFMSYRADDVYKHVISSSFGKTSSDSESRRRYVTPQIRLGEKSFDNFKYNSQCMPSRDGRSASTVTIPYDDNATDGISTNLWEATLSRYNYSLAAYQQAKSKASTSTAEEDKAPCFSDAPVEKYYENPYDLDKLKLNDKSWQERLNAISAVFKADANLTYGSVSLDYEVSRSYVVNTDGTEVAQNRRSARIMLMVQAIADDGMQLPLMQDYFAFNPDSLPSQDVLVASAKDLLTRVEALRKAPVANPYTGPAILSGPASGVFFHEIFGHRLEGHRLKEGGETFKNMVGKSVLPTSFQVFCDPTLNHYAGTDMNGYYLYDSEGVKARRVDNVVNGVLRSFLVNRVPLDGFPVSNGHGRASFGNDPVSRQSNLVVETKSPYTEEQLRQMLRREAKKQGKEYGYYFRTVTSGYTMTGEGGSINSFNVTPVEVYRVFVDGRKDELVRGVSLIGTPLSMFSHIQAGGNQPSTFTGFCGAESGWVPVTASSPAIFVSQIETQRARKGLNIPPALPAPAFTEKNGNVDNVIFSAMKDEMKRTVDSLRVEGAPAPFWTGYITNRYRSFSVTGELGGISDAIITPWKTNIMTHVLLGNNRHNSDVPMQPLIIGGTSDDELSYNGLRRSFWQSSFMAYVNSVNMMARKQNYLSQNPLPSALEKIPDMQRSAPGTYVFDSKDRDSEIDMAKLQQYAKTLSAIFEDYKYLTGTSVKISGDQLDSYRSTSENVNIKQPHDMITVKVSARFMDEDRVRLADDMVLQYKHFSELPPLDTLVAKVRRFADACMAMRNAPALKEDYKGPVMYEDDAARQVFTENYLMPDKFYAQPSFAENPKSLGLKIGKKIMDERLTITNETARTDWNGTPLYGNYTVDADGFKPQPTMTIVDKGVFKMMLNRVTPAQYALKSTGSARWYNDPAQAIPGVGIGTLTVSATGTTNAAKMKKTLVKLAKKAKVDCAYVISKPADYASLRLYRVDLKTGERTLVKTNLITLPTQDQMKHLEAISSSSQVVNCVRPYTYSVVTPSSVIIGDMELSVPTMKGSRKPELVYPLQR